MHFSYIFQYVNLRYCHSPAPLEVDVRVRGKIIKKNTFLSKLIMIVCTRCSAALKKSYNVGNFEAAGQRKDKILANFLIICPQKPQEVKVLQNWLPRCIGIQGNRCHCILLDAYPYFGWIWNRKCILIIQYRLCITQCVREDVRRKNVFKRASPVYGGVRP